MAVLIEACGTYVCRSTSSKNLHGSNGLAFVSGDDSIEAARALVTRNPAFPQITDSMGATPHFWACLVAPDTS